MGQVKYDRIGANYNATRRADPYLFSRMQHHLNPSQGQHYLDVGCGTGNYTIKFIEAGFSFTGVDPSEKMLGNARNRHPESDWELGVAEKLPFDDHQFDGVLATLTTQHWNDLGLAFSELSRVLKSGSRIVVFTSTPFQIETLWLNEYFPAMLQRLAAVMPSFERTETAMNEAGINIEQIELYDVHEGLEDLFLLSGTYTPSLYLDPNFRNGISSFSALADPDELESGLASLEQDIKSSRVNQVIESWKNDRGAYQFIQARLS